MEREVGKRLEGKTVLVLGKVEKKIMTVTENPKLGFRIRIA